MNTFAHITGTIVDNISVAPSDFIEAGWLDITTTRPQPGIGWTYAGGVFTAPPPPLAPTPIVPVLTSASATLAADVTLTSSGTWYDGPSLLLAAGTWLVTAHITLAKTATTAITYFSRISTGATHYASSQQYQASVANHSTHLALTALVTIADSTTVKIQSTSNAGAASVAMKAATTINNSGNNATTITAVRVS